MKNYLEIVKNFRYKIDLYYSSYDNIIDGIIFNSYKN